MSIEKTEPSEIKVGVVGIGLMGSSIIVSLLIAGHEVKAVAPIPEDLAFADSRIRSQLNHCRISGLLEEPVEFYESRLTICKDYDMLSSCDLVLECVIEDIAIKASVYKEIAEVTAKDTIIATNTSAIAISMLQQMVPHPERFIGVHWAEPAYATRFMEITCGRETRLSYGKWIFRLAHRWGKEPTLLRKDIKGFITNRLMYAVYREAFYLIGNGHASMKDVDKAFRYDAGSWITLMGIFRRMDLAGLESCAAIFKALFPLLCNETRVPPIMQEMVDRDARGTQNLTGLYEYTEEEAKEWEEAFARFNKDIFELAALYPSGRMRPESENASGKSF